MQPLGITVKEAWIIVECQLIMFRGCLEERANGWTGEAE